MMNVKKKLNNLVLLLILPLLLLKYGCSDEIPITELKTSEAGEKVKFDKYAGELYSKEISFNQALDSVLSQYGLDDKTIAPYKSRLEMLKLLNIRYNVHAIKYNTIDPNGNPIVASGIIYYPIDSAPKGVIEVSPVNKCKRDCGTSNYYIAEALPSMLGYVCIIPDLIGCGETKDMPIAYLQNENTAIVSADMRKAAEEYIHYRYNEELSNESSLFGYSLGGAGVMSLDRYYTQHPELGVKVKSLFAGGGPYEPAYVIKEQFATNRCDYAVTPNILLSMNYYDNLHLDFNKIFVGKLKDHYKEWCDGRRHIADLTNELGTDIRGYISADFIRDFYKGKKYENLVKYMENKNIPLDWIPESKVFLFHAKNDYYVPKICGERMYKYLKNGGADVEYIEYDAEHILGGMLMAIDYIYELI